MTKKINNIVFYDFEDTFGPHTQVCVFYEDGTVKNMSEEEGELAQEVLANQLGIEQAQLTATKKLHHVTGEELERDFQTYKKLETKEEKEPKKETLGQKLKSKLSKTKEGKEAKKTKTTPIEKKSSKKIKEQAKDKKPLLQRVLAKVRNSLPLKWAVAITEKVSASWEKTNLSKKVSAFFNKKKEKQPKSVPLPEKKEQPVSPWQEEFDEFQQKQEAESMAKKEQAPILESQKEEPTKKEKINQALESARENLAKNIVEAMAKNQTPTTPKVAPQK